MPRIEPSLEKIKRTRHNFNIFSARLYLLIFQYPFDSFTLATNKVKNIGA